MAVIVDLADNETSIEAFPSADRPGGMAAISKQSTWPSSDDDSLDGTSGDATARAVATHPPPINEEGRTIRAALPTMTTNFGKKNELSLSIGNDVQNAPAPPSENALLAAASLSSEQEEDAVAITPVETTSQPTTALPQDSSTTNSDERGGTLAATATTPPIANSGRGSPGADVTPTPSFSNDGGLDEGHLSHCPMTPSYEDANGEDEHGVEVSPTGERKRYDDEFAAATTVSNDEAYRASAGALVGENVITPPNTPYREILTTPSYASATSFYTATEYDDNSQANNQQQPPPPPPPPLHEAPASPTCSPTEERGVMRHTYTPERMRQLLRRQFPDDEYDLIRRPDPVAARERLLRQQTPGQPHPQQHKPRPAAEQQQQQQQQQQSAFRSQQSGQELEEEEEESQTGAVSGMIAGAKQWWSSRRERIAREELARQVEEQRRKLLEETRQRKRRSSAGRVSGSLDRNQTYRQISGVGSAERNGSRRNHLAPQDVEDDFYGEECEDGVKVLRAVSTPSGDGMSVNVEIPLFDESPEEEEDDKRDEESGTDEDWKTDVKIQPEPPSKYPFCPYLLTQTQMNSIAALGLPPSVMYCHWNRLYPLARDGDSFDAAFLPKVQDQTRTLLVVKTTRGFVFGGYAGSGWEGGEHNHIMGGTFYGSAQAFLFKIERGPGNGSKDEGEQQSPQGGIEDNSKQKEGAAKTEIKDTRTIKKRTKTKRVRSHLDVEDSVLRPALTYASVLVGGRNQNRIKIGSLFRFVQHDDGDHDAVNSMCRVVEATFQPFELTYRE